MRGYWILALCAIVAPAGAQQVYKCVTGGQTVYQSHQCEHGPASKTWDSRRPVVAAKRQAEIDRERLQADRHVAVMRQQVAGGGSYVPPRGRTSEQDRHARCEAAKRERDRQLERLGLQRKHADLRRLGDQVYEACKP